MGHSPLCTIIQDQPNHSGYSTKTNVGLHSIECPPGRGWAKALGGPAYLGNPATQASVQYVVDAVDIDGGVDEDDWAWGMGSPASQHTIHIEQAGYAAFTTDQWRGNEAAIGSQYQRPNGSWSTYSAQDAVDMACQFELVAQLIADICKRHGWSAAAATDDEIRRECNGEDLGKHFRHMDATRSVGGTTHTDPGPGYPWSELLAKVQGLIDNKPVPPTPPTPPASFEGVTDMLQCVKEIGKPETYAIGAGHFIWLRNAAETSAARKFKLLTTNVIAGTATELSLARGVALGENSPVR